MRITCATPCASSRVLGPHAAANHHRRRDAVDLLADRPDEVASTTGRKEDLKAVVLQEVYELDHRAVDELLVRHVEPRVLGFGQEVQRVRLELLDGSA